MVIISQSFKQDFLKLFHQSLLIELVNKLNQASLINLKTPYKKFKLNLNQVATRGVAVIVFENKIVPIFIVKKSNKQYGNNLIINKEIALVLKKKFEDTITDIQNCDYESFV